MDYRKALANMWRNRVDGKLTEYENEMELLTLAAMAYKEVAQEESTVRRQAMASNEAMWDDRGRPSRADIEELCGVTIPATYDDPTMRDIYDT